MKNRNVITENDLPPEVVRAIREGRKIEAIKLLREATGLGLANAKVLVDKAARRHGIAPRPAGIVEEESNLGRLVKALLVVVVIYAVYHYFHTAA